jgi:hypothetical protein
MRTIRLHVETPNINSALPILHTGTSWQVSKDDAFTDNLLIANSLNDVINLTSYDVSIDNSIVGTLYVRTMYHFSDSSTSGWSNIVPFDSLQIGLKVSSSAISTPKVSYELDYDGNIEGHLVINASKFQLFTGVGNHESTTWIITDTDGKVVYERKNDKDNLTSFTVDLGEMSLNKIYLIKVQYNSTNKNSSNFGITSFTIYNNDSGIFDITTPFPLVPEQWLYFVLKVFTSKFKTVDIIIRDDLGDIVASNYDQTSKTPRIYTGVLRPNIKYTVQARIKLIDGSVTKYRTVFKSVIKNNQLIEFSDNISYLDAYTYTQPLVLNSTVIQSTSQFYNGTIFGVKNNDTNIYRYVISNKQLLEVGTLLSIVGTKDPLDIPFFNFIPLNSGRLLVDYSLDVNHNKYKKSRFTLYDYNTITHELTEINTVIRENERYSTGMSTSAAVVNHNEVYYVPTLELDSQGNEINLSLKKLNTETMEITIVKPLPFNATRYVSLVSVDTDTILAIGGSNTFETLNDVNVFTRTNNDIWKYKISTDTWTNVGTLPIDISKYIYNFQLYTRRDYKVVIFNASEVGPEVSNQRTILLDTTDYTIVHNDNDHADSMEYLNSIVLRNGDILRVSSNVKDPQKVYTYVSNTYTTTVDIATVDATTDLVVNAGQLITIENPYMYNSITIEGTTYADSGTLHWIDGNLLRTYTFRDLILTRDRNISEATGDKKWDSITLLLDNTLTFST